MKGLVGGILLAVGILVMTGSGICSLAVIFGGLSGPDGLKNLPMIWLPIVFGGVPAGIGFAMFFIGRKLVREANAERDVESGS